MKEKRGVMLMGSEDITRQALESLQRKVGGTIKAGRLYPLVKHFSAFNGSPPPLIEDKSWSWYVVKTETMHEELATQKLKRERFPAYFPQEPKSVRKNQFERRIVMRALLVPGYIFTSFGPDDRWKDINSIRYVQRVLAFGDRPVPVPEHAMQRIRYQEEMRALTGRKRPVSPVDVGQTVQLDNTTPLPGFFGLVTELLEGGWRIIVEVDIFGRQTPVEVSVNQVRAV